MPRNVAIIAAFVLASLSSVTRSEEVEHPIYRSWANHKVGTSITLRTSDGALTRLAMVDGSRMTFVESGMTAVYSK